MNRQTRKKDSDLERDVMPMLERVERFRPEALQRAMDPDCPNTEGKRIRVKLQRLLDAVDAASDGIEGSKKR